MKKLIVLFVVLTIAMISVLPSFAEDEKAFHLISTANDGLGDKIDYPWMNMQMLGGLTWRTLFFVEPDMATIGPDLASGYEVSDDTAVGTSTRFTWVYCASRGVRVLTCNGVAGSQSWKSFITNFSTFLVFTSLTITI